MELTADGAQHHPRLFTPDQAAELGNCLAQADPSRPGIRITASSGLESHLGPATDLAQRYLGPAGRPVRATLFDKSQHRNWSLGWHQDRTIAVRERIEVPGFTRWTLKSRIHHVVPPIAFLQRMLTLRIHLDSVGSDNAPLLIVPGSHLLGCIAEPDIPAAADRFGTAHCLAEPGDVWLYATLILHASAAASAPRRRRVLQILYSPELLPGGLQWLGV